MATLRFDGTDDYVAGTAPGGLDGAYTLAVLVKRVTFNTTDALISTFSSAPAAGFSFHMTGSKPDNYNDNAGSGTAPSTDVPGPLSVDDTDLRILVISRGSGETPRFHIKNLTDATSWAHGDGETAQTTNPDPATGGINVGRFHFPGTGDFDYANVDIGLVGWWDDVEMSDGQVEALSTNLQTSDWHGHSAGTPSSLTEFTSTTPTDIEGLVTWANNGPTATGDSMSLWTFDGGGSAPSPVVFRSRRVFI